MLKAVVKNLEEVPESIRGVYVKPQIDGKEVDYYIPAIEHVPGYGYGFEDIEGLKNSLANAKEERRQFSDKLKTYEGIDPKVAREAMSKWDELKKFDPATEADRLAQQKVEAFRRQIVEEAAKDGAGKDEKIGRLEKAIGDLTVTAQTVAALNKQKGSQKLLLDAIRSQCRWRFGDDGNVIVEVLKDGIPRVGDAQGNPLTIEQLVEGMKADPDYGRAFEGTGASGSGAPAGAAATQPASGARLIRTKSDFQNVKEKVDFISKHGSDAYLKLPDK